MKKTLPTDFRIFIDAATLKLANAKLTQQERLDFRIFIDAATLKLAKTSISSYAHSTDFRIFIDAATLKPQTLPDRRTKPSRISASL